MRPLLKSVARARESLVALFPFNQFKDCAVGSVKERGAAYEHNRRMRHALRPYINRWAQASCLFAGALGASGWLAAPALIQAALGVSVSASCVITLVQALMWLYLSMVKSA